MDPLHCGSSYPEALALLLQRSCILLVQWISFTCMRIYEFLIKSIEPAALGGAPSPGQREWRLDLSIV